MCSLLSKPTVAASLSNGFTMPSGDPGNLERTVDYSAVECIQRASAAVGRPIDMSRLLLSKNLPQNGATANSLALLAKQHGLSVQLYDDLSPAQLCSATGPAILHVQGSRYSTSTDHYIVCLGIAEKTARIFNPPAMEKVVPLEALATRWRGETLVFSASDAEIDLRRYRYKLYLPTIALWLTAAVGILGIGRARLQFAKRAIQLRPLPVTLQAVLFLVAAAILGCSVRLLSGNGLVVYAARPASDDGLDPMEFLLRKNWQSGCIDTRAVSLEAALRLHSEGTLFIDARNRGEFAIGHIKGAINCPANEASRVRLNMAGIPKDKKVAVYCNSAQCGRGRYLMGLLMQEGYADSVLYGDGWVRWTGPSGP
jgi:rhodanese-related sulfurtransferase